MNGKAYYLDLQTLLDYLSVHGESCVLTTTLKERNRVGYVVVSNGAMVNCYISEGEKVVLQGKQAHKVLAKYSEWYVQLQYDQQGMFPPSAAPQNFSPSTPYNQPLPPIKSGPLSSEPEQNFPREQSSTPRSGPPGGQSPTANPKSGPISGQGPALYPSSSNDQPPTPKSGPISGQGPALYPGSPNDQLPGQRPRTPSGPIPVQRSNAPLRWFPVLKRELLHEEFLALPTRQRMIIRLVLTMVNGRRSVEEIKAQLQLSPETVESVLEYLRALNVIE